MKTPLRCLTLLAALAFTACSDPRSDALARLRKISVSDLRTDAARLHTQFFTAPSTAHVPLAPYHWSETAKNLKPIRLNLYRDGLAIALRQDPGVEFGVHVVPRGMAGPPVPSPYVRYEQLEEGIYWYSLKR